MKCNNQAAGSTVQGKGPLTRSRTPVEQLFESDKHQGGSLPWFRDFTLDTPLFTVRLYPDSKDLTLQIYTIWFHTDGSMVSRSAGLPVREAMQAVCRSVRSKMKWRQSQLSSYVLEQKGSIVGLHLFDRIKGPVSPPNASTAVPFPYHLRLTTNHFVVRVFNGATSQGPGISYSVQLNQKGATEHFGRWFVSAATRATIAAAIDDVRNRLGWTQQELEDYLKQHLESVQTIRTLASVSSLSARR